MLGEILGTTNQCLQQQSHNNQKDIEAKNNQLVDNYKYQLFGLTTKYSVT